MATVVLPEPSRALYPFRSQFVTLSDGRQMHYVDEGPPDGELLVFVHGYPTWSFTYRALLVYYAARGYRCVAMDHIGFGLSDKPTGGRYHTLRRHIHNLHELISTLQLKDLADHGRLGRAVGYDPPLRERPPLGRDERVSETYPRA